MRDTGSLYIDGKPGRTCTIKGKEYLFFSGYNYLGLSTDLEFNALVEEGAAKYGWVFPSSRISNTRLALYEEAEALLSQITNSEDTVLMPSGYAAGRMSTSYFDRLVYNAPGSHPAILQHRSGFVNFHDWKEWLLNTTLSDHTAPVIIAADAVSPLTASINDFSFLKNLAGPAVMVIDDSHGIGILGKNGEGISSSLPSKTGLEYLLTYSLSKAYGIPGGAISCTGERAKYFRSLPAYTGITPISPAPIYAFIRGQHIYQRQLKKLQENLMSFKAMIAERQDIIHVDKFPVFILPLGLNEVDFYMKDIVISSFSYPDPAGQKLNRIVINAAHTQNDLQQLAAILKSLLPPQYFTS
jgi:8-amino-7-oxononanoate synthase